MSKKKCKLCGVKKSAHIRYCLRFELVVTMQCGRYYTSGKANRRIQIQ